MQIHQPEDFANILTGAYYTKNTESIHLKRNHEYYIDILPVGQRSSEALKNLDIESRNCLLKEEVPSNSILKQYSQSNSKYECYVGIAQNMCRCLPWDFLHNDNFFEQECDVFGRTCFFHALENLTTSAEDVCPHCKEACDFTHYKKFITSDHDYSMSRYIVHTDISSLITRYKTPFPKYFSKPFGYLVGNFIQENEFTSLDIENLIMATDTIFESKDTLEEYAKLDIKNSMIVIHLRFLKPQIHYVDVTYSTWDKFANFGGNFGIFAEITGCTFLGMLNFIILVVKLCTSRAYARCKMKLKMLIYHYKRKKKEKVVKSKKVASV